MSDEIRVGSASDDDVFPGKHKEPDSPAAISIPSGMIEALKNVAIMRGPKTRISFDPSVPGKTYTKEECQAELTALFKQVSAWDEIHKYRDDRGVHYEPPKTDSSGSTTTVILPELTGCPLSNLILGYVDHFRPTSIRVTRGCVTCDAEQGRVTIFVDEHDKVRKIEQEIGVLYGCGADMRECLEALIAGKEPKYWTIMYTDGRKE